MYTSLSELFLQYINQHCILGILFLFSLIYYVCKAFRAGKRPGAAALLAFFFPLLTVFNPLLYPRLAPLADGGTSYYRFIWAVPLVTLSACFLTEIICFVFRALEKGYSRRQKKAKEKTVRKPAVLTAVFSLILCAVILFNGTSYLVPRNLSIPENKFAISRAALDISQFIQDDPDHTEESVILAPTELMMELECFDLSLVPALPRNEYIAYGTDQSVYEPLLSLVLEGAHRNTEYIAWNLSSLHVKYVAALTLFGLDSYMDSIGYSVLNRTGDYTLYRYSGSIETPGI